MSPVTSRSRQLSLVNPGSGHARPDFRGQHQHVGPRVHCGAEPAAGRQQRVDFGRRRIRRWVVPLTFRFQAALSAVCCPLHAMPCGVPTDNSLAAILPLPPHLASWASFAVSLATGRERDHGGDGHVCALAYPVLALVPRDHGVAHPETRGLRENLSTSAP